MFKLLKYNNLLKNSIKNINYFSTKPPKSAVYTRTGDKGRSSLYNGERRAKNDPIFEALGNTDELNSVIGLAHTFCDEVNNGLSDKLTIIQSRLLDLGAAIATPKDKTKDEKLQKVKFPEDQVLLLENWIDEIDSKLPPLKSFILPSGGRSSSAFHIARTVCRRAERSVIDLVANDEVDPVVGKYLNRLSDFMYVAGRYAANFENKKEISWIPHQEFK